MDGGVGHGLVDLRNAIALYQDNNNKDTRDNNNKVTEKKKEAANKNRVRNEVPTKKPQVVHDKDGMSEKKLNPTKTTSTQKGNLKKRKKATKKAKKEILKVDLRKLVREVEEQKQILIEHQRILNQLLNFYKSTKNKSISLYRICLSLVEAERQNPCVCV